MSVLKIVVEASSNRSMSFDDAIHTYEIKLPSGRVLRFEETVVDEWDTDAEALRKAHGHAEDIQSALNELVDLVNKGAVIAL